MENENRYASKGVGGTALGLSIGALGAELLGGTFNNILGGNRNGCEGHMVSRYELGLQQEIAAKDSKIGLLEANIYSDAKIADVYERLNTKFETKIGCLEAQINQQSVINAQITANLACQQNTLNTLMGLTKTIIPINNVCPEPMPALNSWTAPTAAA